jgi:hypothetical protein
VSGVSVDNVPSAVACGSKGGNCSPVILMLGESVCSYESIVLL